MLTGARTQTRPLSAEAFRAMFKMDGSKQALKPDNGEEEIDSTKVGLRRQNERGINAPHINRY